MRRTSLVFIAGSPIPCPAAELEDMPPADSKARQPADDTSDPLADRPAWGKLCDDDGCRYSSFDAYLSFFPQPHNVPLECLHPD